MTEESEDTGPMCKCGEPVEYGAWHPCPFKSEIHNDDTECNCCSDCQYQCSQDI